MIEVLLGAVALDVEDVYQQLDAAEYRLAIALEVALVEGVLPPAVPQVKH